MIHLIFIVLLLMKEKPQINPQNVDKIIIRSVTFDELYMSVNCNSFETRFEGQYTEITFNKKSEILPYIGALNEAKLVRIDDNGDLIDVRKKVFICYTSGDTDTICSDLSSFYYKGKIWDFNE